MCKIGKDLNVKTRVVFKSFKIGQYFSLKDVTPKEIKANVIYKFTGSCDKSITYIGKTIRHLATRSKEHLENNSAIFDHIKTCQNCQSSNIENFQIRSTGNSDKDIRIKETLLIINNQLTHKGMSYFLHLFCLLCKHIQLLLIVTLYSSLISRVCIPLETVLIKQHVYIT